MSRTKKLPILAVFTWFLILGKIQDGDHAWWRHRPPAGPPPIKYTSSCWEDQRLSAGGKIVSKYCNISKTLGWCSIDLLLYRGGGMTLRVCPRLKFWSGFSSRVTSILCGSWSSLYTITTRNPSLVFKRVWQCIILYYTMLSPVFILFFIQFFFRCLITFLFFSKEID